MASEALQVEKTALKGELQRLKELLQQKDEELEDANLTDDHFIDRIGLEIKCVTKAKTSLSSKKKRSNCRKKSYIFYKKSLS